MKESKEVGVYVFTFHLLQNIPKLGAIGKMGAWLTNISFLVLTVFEIMLAASFFSKIRYKLMNTEDEHDKSKIYTLKYIFIFHMVGDMYCFFII